MSSEESGKSENFGSAAHLMIEALEKASKELEETVEACLAQVREHSDGLEKALAGRLKKFFEQSGNSLDGHVDDLSNKKEEFIERLMEFERTELETLTATAKEIRQQVNAKAQQATDSINRLVEEQVAELKAFMNEPKPVLHEIVDARLEVVKEIGRASKDKIEESESGLEKVISERAEEFDRGILAVVEESKRVVEDKLDEHNRQFEAKINSVITNLTDAVTQAGDDLKDRAHEGRQKVDAASEKGRDRLFAHLKEFSRALEEIQSSFSEQLLTDREVQEGVHKTKLDRKAQEVREEIEHIAGDASTKIAASHKLFYSSLKRLEKKYFDRMDRLFSRYESALAQEGNLASGTKPQATSELRTLLASRLQARGDEVIKSFQRHVEQIESEYSRSSAGYHDRIENIKNNAVEAMEKQVKMMNQEMDRVTRNFNNGMSDLNIELPQISERGQAAALAVKAYRSAMLSLEGDD
ncbi:MAG: hypothetical protein IT342_23750 [Candidatus Melainabacteria bacterium]|nr:hypothetical protein [Candidatus Melainabacteria bacterium]